MQARLDMLDEKARGVGREAPETLYDRCDLHATGAKAAPLLVMATTMGNASATLKRKIRQNALRGFMAQTPPTAVHPMVFTDSAELAAEVRAETAKVDRTHSTETAVLDFEQEHGWPTFAGMMKRAEAEAIKLGSPFYGCRDHKLLYNFVYWETYKDAANESVTCRRIWVPVGTGSRHPFHCQTPFLATWWVM